jgi:hypothetical protein
MCIFSDKTVGLVLNFRSSYLKYFYQLNIRTVVAFTVSFRSRTQPGRWHPNSYFYLRSFNAIFQHSPTKNSKDENKGHSEHVAHGTARPKRYLTYFPYCIRKYRHRVTISILLSLCFYPLVILEIIDWFSWTLARTSWRYRPRHLYTCILWHQ